VKDPDLIKQLNKELNEVYRFLLKLRIPKEDAQDLVQETAYKYLKYEDSINIKKVKSWLTRVALNLHHDQYRKNKRLQYGFEMENFQSFRDDFPEEILITNENNQEIEHVLKKLKPQYRELLLLKYQFDLKYEEISELLDMKLGTIKTSLYRARQKFIEEYRRSYK